MAMGRAQRTFAAAAVAVLAAGTSSCGGGVDKTGGAGGDDPLVLRVAQYSFDPSSEMTAWADEVNRASDGEVRVVLEDDWRSGAIDFDAGTIADVVDGRIDAAIVSIRGLDTIGVTSLQPLMAPLLIDSYELEQAVFDAGIPARMAEDVRRLGVEPIGVLPGALLRILGTTQPFTRAGDFAGAVIGVQQSDLAYQTIRALGGAGRFLPVGVDLDDVDINGYVVPLWSVAVDRYWEDASFVTTNLVMWPRPLLVVMNEDAWHDLDDSVQRLLIEATNRAAPAAIAAARRDDVESTATLCREGMDLTLASEDDLAALREAVEPVYDELRADPASSDLLARITALKADVGATAESPSCPAGAGPDTTVDDGAGGLPKGTFELTLSPDQWPSGCESEAPYPVDYVLALHDGIAEIHERSIVGSEWQSGWYGHYDAFRDRVTLVDSAGAMTARWTFDGTALRFSDLENFPGCGDEVIWAMYPWTVAAATDSSPPP